MTITIRSASHDDAASIVSLISELAENEGEECELDAVYALKYLDFPGNDVLLAVEGEQVLGLLSCSTRPNLFHAGDGALIEELVVTADARGRGIGGLLVEALVEHLAQQGCEEVSVSTMPGNHGAIAFYKKHGFEDEALYLERHFD
jgi:ribosomal protein S18 acetylase RimI-like enzyme